MEFLIQVQKDLEQKDYHGLAMEIINNNYTLLENIPSREVISDLLKLIFNKFQNVLPDIFNLKEYIVSAVKYMPTEISISSSNSEVQRYLLEEFAEFNMTKFYFWSENLKDKENKREPKSAAKQFQKELLYKKASIVVYHTELLPLIDSLLFNLQAFILEIETEEEVISTIGKVIRLKKGINKQRKEKPFHLFDLWLFGKDLKYRKKSYQDFIKNLYNEKMIDTKDEEKMCWVYKDGKGNYQSLACLLYILIKSDIINLEGIITKELFEVIVNTFHNDLGGFRNYEQSKRKKAWDKLKEEFKLIENVVESFHT